MNRDMIEDLIKKISTDPANNRRILLDIKASVTDSPSTIIVPAKDSKSLADTFHCPRPIGCDNEGNPIFKEGPNERYMILHADRQYMLLNRARFQEAAKICLANNDFHNAAWIPEVAGRPDLAIKTYQQLDERLKNIHGELIKQGEKADGIIRFYARLTTARLNCEKAGLFLNAASFAKEGERFELADAYNMLHERIDPSARARLFK